MGERHLTVTRALAFGLIAGWAALTLIALTIAEFAGARFLNLPLGAFVAAQGVVLVASLLIYRQSRDG
jgi:uncharacterized membrane protein